MNEFLIGRGANSCGRSGFIWHRGLVDWLIGRPESLEMEDRDICDVFQE
jgi:hypothetical protein